jgi:hypothetical protein
MDAAYREISIHLAHRRHPATRFIVYENTAITNPVCTFSRIDESAVDIEELHVSDTGVNLKTATSDLGMYVVKPRSWAVVSDALYSENPEANPAFYTLMGSTAGLEVWMAAPPNTAGTNSLRAVVYGVQDWSSSTSSVCPLPHIYDQLLINKGAIWMRTAKDMELNDLVALTAPLEGRMLQTTAEPRQEQDYNFGVAGKSSLSHAKHGLNHGRIRRS